MDIHAHLLPGIDDGPRSLEESLPLLKALNGLGFSQLIATPHVSHDFYPNSPATIFSAFEQLNLAKEGVPPHFIHSVAAEYLVDDEFMNKINGAPLLTLPGNRVLFELPFSGAPMNCEEVVFGLSLKGYQPVLAHPERYGYWYKSGETLKKLVAMGCELQVNILSLLGYYGSAVRNAGYSLLDQYDVHFLATDCHNLQHVDSLTKGLRDKELVRLLNSRSFKNVRLLD